REVIVDDDERQATVIVPDDQLSLAIGRDGQNARLAARLTGWRVDIKSETEFSQEDQDVEYEGEEQTDGRCMAVLSNGRRCPNAAIADSTYCGLPQHQALSRFETSQLAVLAPLSEAEVEILADPDAEEGIVSEIVERAEAQFEEPVEEPEEDTVAEVDAEESIPDASTAGPDELAPPAEEASEEEPAEEEASDAEPEAEEAAEEATEDEPEADEEATEDEGDADAVVEEAE
ncbi:MAG TPA: hypothetical protein VFI09_11975, partial [Solirubrobacterales bacterium]|nr:hypothetical protein [Solirubrobacterales bacterium]